MKKTNKHAIRSTAVAVTLLVATALVGVGISATVPSATPAQAQVSAAPMNFFTWFLCFFFKIGCPTTTTTTRPATTTRPPTTTTRPPTTTTRPPTTTTTVPGDPTLQAQLARATQLTMQYPTVGAATAAGFTRVGPFIPLLGAHYLAPGGSFSGGGFNVDRPIIWLFAGDEPTSPVVGLMYYVAGSAAPAGFSGSADMWHVHTGLCFGTMSSAGIAFLLPVDKDNTKAECDAVGGRYVAQTGWMLHVWAAPAWIPPEGVFAHENELLLCTDRIPADQAPPSGCKGTS